jgi:hypothetical protein
LGRQTGSREGPYIFLDIIKELDAEGLLESDVVSGVHGFIEKNYLDPRFENKMAGLRAGIFSYARWKRTIDPGYRLDRTFFNKAALNRRLRAM